MNVRNILLISIGSLCFVSCNDFLDREPLDKITPEIYFSDESQLAAYSLGCYNFQSYSTTEFSVGPVADDNGTDNQVASNGSTALWVPGEKRVPETGGAWDFSAIRKVNYFFEKVLPKYNDGTIKGDENNIRHYIGEMYFMRAYNYYNKLVALGDFPIVTEVLPDQEEPLIEASIRRPRNEVARFILEDLDKAYDMMLETSPNGKNRLSKNVALLFKSRVALFEGTWLKYHKGTARVPGTSEWPGKKMDYNKDFTIDIDKEIEFFLTEAKNASKLVADNIILTECTDLVNPEKGEPYNWNPYFEMFSAVDMEPINEILMWRDYDTSLGVGHAVGVYLAKGGADLGYTRGLVDAFLMNDGTPFYASSDYKGDLTLKDVKTDRDKRLQLFIAEPDDTLRLSSSKNEVIPFGAPAILSIEKERCTTGYAIRKFMTYDQTQVPLNTAGRICSYGCIIFRGVEALLNYIEADCELRNGESLDDVSWDYWKKIRTRVGLPGEKSEILTNTVDKTQLDKENDWAKYSGDELVSPLLFNIRRERRIELMSEGFRMEDLKRWRSLDKVTNYQIEGFNLWGGEIEKLYDGKLIPTGTPGKVPNVSSKEISGTTYLRVYQINNKNNLLFDGYSWCDANYLEPIAARQFTLTASNPDDPETSVIYQNPGWSKIANESAIGY